MADADYDDDAAPVSPPSVSFSAGEPVVGNIRVDPLAAPRKGGRPRKAPAAAAPESTKKEKGPAKEEEEEEEVEETAPAQGDPALYRQFVAAMQERAKMMGQARAQGDPATMVMGHSNTATGAQAPPAKEKQEYSDDELLGLLIFGVVVGVSASYLGYRAYEWFSTSSSGVGAETAGVMKAAARAASKAHK